MKYRAALLPRAYKAYVPMTEDSWRTFLADADVLENGITTLKAELVFAALAQKGEMDYRSFRQAMRQVAVALYPQLPEADALKLLGQKHVFPKVKLAPEKRLPIYSRINRSPTRRDCWSYLSEKEAWYATRPSARRRSRRCGGPSPMNL